MIHLPIDDVWTAVTGQESSRKQMLRRVKEGVPGARTIISLLQINSLSWLNMQFFDFGTFGELIPIEGNLDEKGHILYGLFETSEDVEKCNPAVITKAHMLTTEQKEAARKHKSELSDTFDRGVFKFL